MNSLDAAIRQFEATEANLEKLDRLWEQIEKTLPNGPAFGGPPEYEEWCLAFRQIVRALPAIDGFRVEDRLFDFDAAGQMHLDALEVGELEAQVAVANELAEQGRMLREYRFRLQAKRRDIIRSRALILVDEIDSALRCLEASVAENETSARAAGPGWVTLQQGVAELDTLLGSAARPERWGDLRRHLHFGMVGDLADIIKFDWPAVKNSLRPALYGQHDPVPVAVADLGELVAAKPQGHVASKLAWSVLSDEDFERLTFLLISHTEGYENPEWLQQTRAPDRGRDLSVTRVEKDQLSGVRRYRVIIQCKHWTSRSVSAADVNEVRGQMELWHPPRVDRLIVATTGRFTADAIAMVEQHNQADRALRIDMWPESHLERLLAARPHLIGEFRLRRAP